MKFLAFATYEPAALAGLMENPHSRSEAVAEMVQAVGGRLEAFYATVAPHDVCCLVEVPDGTAMKAIETAIKASGACSHFQVHPLFEADAQRDIMTKAREARSAYRPPIG